MNYYISDLHIGCVNKHEGRTLKHDQILKDNWNAVATNSDTVYVIGDIGRIGSNKDNEYLCSILSTLKGHKILIKGNHDDLKDHRITKLFDKIVDREIVTDNNKGKTYKLVIDHFPILIWEHQHKGYIHLYGHVHETDEYDVYKESLALLNKYFEKRRNDGATDCPEAVAYNCFSGLLNYTPCTINQIIDKFSGGKQ